MIEVASLALAVAALLLWRQSALARQELLVEVDALADAFSGSSTHAEPSRALSRHPRVQAAWLRCHATGGMERLGGLERCFSLAASVPESEASGDQLPREISAVIRRIGSGEIRAVGVFLPDVHGGFNLRVLDGAPERRLRPVLEEMADRCCHDAAGPAWRWVEPRPGSIEDFSMLGIGLHSVLPIEGPSGVEGAVWLGLGGSSGPLPVEERRSLEAVLEFSATLLAGRRRLRERLESQDEERQLLLGLSHDLRSPSTSALYALRQLLYEEHDSLTVEQRERIEMVRACLGEQIAAVNDLLDYVRSRRKHIEVAPAPIVVGEELRRCVARIATPANETLQSGAVSVRLIDGPRLIVSWDPAHFRRVMSNLIFNALKYTDAGTITVSWSAARGLVRCSVADTGIGVPEDDRPKLFRRFERGGNVGARAGSGLGLAVARELALKNESEIRFVPAPGGGSIFTVEIPALDEPGETASSVREDPPGLGTVLVVEDDPALARTIERYLAPYAEKVVVTSSVDGARRLLAQEPVSTLVTDFRLGATSARSFIDEAACRGVPPRIVVVTGAAPEAVRIAPHRAGSVRFLEKPFTRSQLLAAVEWSL